MCVLTCPFGGGAASSCELCLCMRLHFSLLSKAPHSARKSPDYRLSRAFNSLSFSQPNAHNTYFTSQHDSSHEAAADTLPTPHSAASEQPEARSTTTSLAVTPATHTHGSMPFTPAAPPPPPAPPLIAAVQPHSSTQVEPAASAPPAAPPHATRLSPRGCVTASSGATEQLDTSRASRLAATCSARKQTTRSSRSRRSRRKGGEE